MGFGGLANGFVVLLGEWFCSTCSGCSACGEGIGGGVSDGVGGWVRIGCPLWGSFLVLHGVGAVVSFGANRGLVCWKAGV